MYNIPLTDPVRNLISIDVSEVESIPVMTLLKWKLEMEKFVTYFVKLPRSSVIVAYSNKRIHGVYDVTVNVGHVFNRPVNTTLLESINSVYLIIPVNQLSKSNHNIFSIEENPKLTNIKKYAGELLAKMATSQEYKSYTSEELAVRAVQLASQFDMHFENYSNLILEDT